MDRTKKIKKDADVLKAFISVYCRENHTKKGTSVFKNSLCEECFELLNYSLARNENCSLDPKPKCKDCKVHCYKKSMREKIKKVMKFSGIYYILRGRLDWVYRYFF